MESGDANGASVTFSTPASGPFTTLGQTFTTGGECVILSSFVVGLSPQGYDSRVAIRALLYAFDLSTYRVIGSPLASQSESVSQEDFTLPVTFTQPVQLSPATSYAIILTTSGQGQGTTPRVLNLELSSIGNPNEIPGGRLILQTSGDNAAAIETNPFSYGTENLSITII